MPRLGGPPVVAGAPVVGELLDVGEGHATVAVAGQLVGPAGALEPGTEVVEVGLRDRRCGRGGSSCRSSCGSSWSAPSLLLVDSGTNCSVPLTSGTECFVPVVICGSDARAAARLSGRRGQAAQKRRADPGGRAGGLHRRRRGADLGRRSRARRRHQRALPALSEQGGPPAPALPRRPAPVRRGSGGGRRRRGRCRGRRSRRSCAGSSRPTSTRSPSGWPGHSRPTEDMFADARRSGELNDRARRSRRRHPAACGADVTPEDLTLILEMVAAIRPVSSATSARTRELRQRYLSLFLDGLRASASRFRVRHRLARSSGAAGSRASLP